MVLTYHNNMVLQALEAGKGIEETEGKYML